jgi:alkylated DNA repair dioxygenase AlkB
VSVEGLAPREDARRRRVQGSLFGDLDEAPEALRIPGLQYFLEFVSPEDERELVAAIDREVWDTTWDRRRQPYGAGYGRSTEMVRPIPDWGLRLARRLDALNVIDRPFDQMLVNEYVPGQGISLHRDYEPFDRTVVSLSLLAPCVMDFRHVASGRKESLLLERRSLIVLSDEARYEWEHGIARRKSDRWKGRVVPRARRLSVTFRVLKPGSHQDP